VADGLGTRVARLLEAPKALNAKRKAFTVLLGVNIYDGPGNFAFFISSRYGYDNQKIGTHSIPY
jgi:hypothetical protein